MGSIGFCPHKSEDHSKIWWAGMYENGRFDLVLILTHWKKTFKLVKQICEDV